MGKNTKVEKVADNKKTVDLKNNNGKLNEKEIGKTKKSTSKKTESKTNNVETKKELTKTKKSTSKKTEPKTNNLETKKETVQVEKNVSKKAVSKTNKVETEQETAKLEKAVSKNAESNVKKEEVKKSAEKSDRKKEINKDKKIKILLIGLIIVIVLIVGFVLLNKIINKNTKKIEKIPIEELIGEFEGNDVSGEDVKLLLADILGREYSSINGKDEESISIKIKYNINYENKNISGMIGDSEDNNRKFKLIDLRNNIDKSSLYKITYTYNEEHKLTEIIITNK